MSPELADLSLLELFAMELASNRQVVEDGLVGLEDDPGTERFEPLMRAAHSIKGAARIVGLTPVVGLAHAMEDVFQAAQRGQAELTSGLVDALLAANDWLGRLATAEPSSLPREAEAMAQDAARLAEALRALLEGGRPDAAGPAAQASVPTDGTAFHATSASPPADQPGVAGTSGSPASTGAVTAPSIQATPASTARPDGEVRLSADLLGRLMGLAGQCVVEAGSLGRVSGQFHAIRRGLSDLSDLLTGLRASLNESQAEASVQLEGAASLLASIAARQGDAAKSLDGLTRRMEILSDKLYTQVLESRMRPFGEGAKAIPRLVRDLAAELGKKARFTLEGARADVDRDILDRLEAPLMHLARNALDHGLETPEERAAAGKPEKGQITLTARHISGLLEVRFEDDGRGIDLGALREDVSRKGLAAPDIASRLSDDELLDFLFLPGFTTASAVTEVSGRGVGLDVVRSMLQEVGGTVRVESEPGSGTRFVLRLPVSRSVARTLVFLVRGEPYALPLSRIGRVLAVPVGDVEYVEGRQYVRLDGVNVGLAPAAQVLGWPASMPIGGEIPVVVLENAQARYGLAVDAFVGERDLVVHPLDPRLGKVPGVSCASILEDGRPVVILDEADLARIIDGLLEGGGLARVRAGQDGGAKAGPKRVLVVDDSLTVREVERQLLAGRGYEVQTAVDGMEGLAMARMGGFDLIVTDVDMPRMTGIELTRRVKADPALARVPVMIVSYKDRQEDRLAGLSAGADYYLPKSGFKDEALIGAVADLIGEP